MLIVAFPAPDELFVGIPGGDECRTYPRQMLDREFWELRLACCSNLAQALLKTAEDESGPALLTEAFTGESMTFTDLAQLAESAADFALLLDPANGKAWLRKVKAR